MGRVLTLWIVLGLAWLTGEVQALQVPESKPKIKKHDHSHDPKPITKKHDHSHDPKPITKNHDHLHDHKMDTRSKFNKSTDRVLLFQYGKVASTSVENGIGELMRPDTALKWSNPFHLIEAKRKQYPDAAKIHDFEVAKDMLSQIPTETKVWVITATRSTLHRDMSAYFQNLWKHYTRYDLRNMTTAQLHKDFRTRAHRRSTWGQHGDDFFSTSFKGLTGVDMVKLSNQFANGTGLKTSRNHIFVQSRTKSGLNLNVILLRFEDIQKWESVLGRYFPGIRLTHENGGQQKWYAEKYKEFVKTYKMAQYEIDAICGDDTMHFYSKEEKRALVPECDGPLGKGGIEKPRRQAFRFLDESGLLNVNTADGPLLVADLSKDGYDIDEK